MGITLHGIIEWKNGRGGWESIARVKFNKNYEFMRLLHVHAPKGSPEDVHDQGADIVLSWCDLEKLNSILELKPEDSEDPAINRPKATRAFMASLEEDCGAGSTRILFYEI